MKFKLITFSNNLNNIGKLMVGDEVVCYTMEKKWQNNERNISCIPPGSYIIKPVTSPKLETEVMDVQGRSHILFHKANKASQLEGCIAPGSQVGILDGEWAVLRSKAAFDTLMFMLGKDEHDLEVVRY